MYLKVSFAKQSGFLMPVAAFILVVMGLFAVTVTRNSAQTNTATIQEGISIQAFFAAESGAQRGMSTVFYQAGSPTRATADAGCTALNASPEPEITFNVDGLSNCTATLACTRTIDAADTTSFYRINSVGVCGGGDVTSSRSIEVASFIADSE